MKEEQKTIKAMLGLDTAPTMVQTASSVIGGLLFGTGFLGALNASNNQKTYTQATKSEQLRISEIGPAATARAEAAQAGLTADLGSYQAKTEAGVKQGLINRGITDANIGNDAAGQVKAGLSGAYAAAHATLASAKVNAGSAVSGALSTYQQALAQKQYESMLSKYYAKLGIWGSLGGLSTTVMGLDTEKQPNPNVDYNDYIPSVEEMTTPQKPFRMKGVQDSKPFRMMGVE